ncbi:MAG: hypothetical protein IKI30_06570 [Oxalobacter sp.]|nr:hypothetical protein [Oxalobacter sp.]
MKKIFLPIILFICLALSGCGDNKKPEASQPAQQETPTASQQSTSPNEEKPGDKPEETAADTGLGITSDEYQTAYNTHVEQFNTQMKKDPVRMVQLNLKVNGKQFKACTMPYACVDGTMTENGQYINKIAVSGTLTLETPKSLALAPVHMMIGTVSAIKGASIPDIKDLFDKLSGDAQKRHTNTATTVFRGYRIEFSHPKTERIVVTITKASAK